MMMIYIMIFIGVIGVSDDVPVLGALSHRPTLLFLVSLENKA